MRNLTLELYERLCDGEYHTNIELAKEFGHRFGGRLHELKHLYGAEIETIQESKSVYSYKLLQPAKFEMTGSKMKPIRFKQLEIMETPINVGEVELTWFEKIVDNVSEFLQKLFK